MANIKSQIKRNRQNEKRRLRNRDFRGAARSAVKDARASFESGQDTATSVMAAISSLDVAAKKGAIHPRNASRRKGRLMKRLAALGDQPTASTAEPVTTTPLAEEGLEKKPAKVEKAAKPKAETVKKTEAKSVTKAASKKPAAKPAAKKTASKK